MEIHLFSRKLNISRQWLQFGVIVVVILLTMTATYWGSMRIMLVLIAIPFVIAGIYFFLLQPNLIYLMILAGGMFIPFAGPGGFNASILGVILLIGIWFMDMLVVKQKFSWVHSQVVRSALFFIMVTVIAFGMGQVPWFVFANQAPFNAQFGGFVIYLCLPLMMVVTPNLIKDIYWLKLIFWFFIGVTMLYVTGKALSFSLVEQLFQNGYTAHAMLWTWMVALILGQVIFNHELKPHLRWALIGCLLLVFYVAMVQQNDWKSGWVPPLVAAGVLLGLRFKKLTLYAIPFALIVVGYLARDLISTDEYSWGTRLDAWLIVLQISRISPLIGMGFGNYYWYAPLFPIRGYYVKFNSHSQFIDLIAQTGVLGLFGFLWMLFEIVRLAWRLSGQMTDGFARGYSYGVLAGVFGTLMAAFLVDWVLPFAYNIGLNGVRASVLPWIFFGGLISIQHIYASNAKPAPLQAVRAVVSTK